MSQQISLRDAERRVFRTAYNDGLWDIFLGCYFLILVIAPFLSTSLGDFWSSVVFLPFWGLIYLVIRLIRKYVVTPRVGVVRFGPVRKGKLKKFTLLMLCVNIVSLILGLVAAVSIGRISGQVISIFFGLILLTGFSAAAFYLDFTRLYLYGLLLGLAPLVGEWLWEHGYTTHHGFPITFGAISGIMILVGLVIFVRLVHSNPLPAGLPPEGA
jgi:hypothetical protein